MNQRNSRVKNYHIIILFVILFIIFQTIAIRREKSIELVPEEEFINEIELNLVKELNIGSPIVSNPAIQDEEMYVISKDSKIFIIDMKTYEILREISLPKDVKREYNKGIAIYKNYIVLGSSNHIIVINLDNESIVYNKRVAKYSLKKFLISEGILYYSSDGMAVYALDFNTFNLLWKYVESTEHASNYPLIVEDKLYFNGYDDMVIFNKYNGDKVHSFKVDISPDFIIDDGYIYGRNTVAKYLNKINKNTGEVVWQISERPSVPVVDNEYIFYSNLYEKKVVAIQNKNAEKLWDIEILNYPVFNLVPSAKYLFFRRQDGKVMALDKRTGEKLWEKMYKGKYANLLVFNDVFIITDENGTIHFYDISQDE
ncbi:outer membrane protein assembly factor BamB family protein [Alkaliphilus serpentinus]|uniref:PQQ-binding-like beta-propeller repeat protein n=1 Tax=Alkaliphilus serpentinus TaxID=1482731 RepID=A0A833MCG9_9FIRM|nr:PQQ-binding-like beta-propeller repeat protein [Alkaliphilus serpentinus]KAB3524967.1 PQQ-binding-like beta-propeller repeat protein [Alkaliphilus serpentinus]